MTDLISRKDVMALWQEYHPYIATRAIEFDAKLRQLPSAYPKKGKWIPITDGLLSCSKCGTYALAKNPNRYCRGCGADMRESE